MTPEETEIIETFAKGDKEKRGEAIAIFHKYLKDESLQNTDAMLFMSEVDNPCPDLALRNRYRRILTQATLQELPSTPV